MYNRFSFGYDFIQQYGQAITDTENYYAISNIHSLTTRSEYITFMEKCNLNYKETSLDILKTNMLDIIISVKEKLFDHRVVAQICKTQLINNNVVVYLNTSFNRSQSDNYDIVIIATYTNLNQMLLPEQYLKFQFELCEKPVIQLPEKYKNKSVVIMDGPFMCIDPLGNTPYHVMGNVVHAIHHCNIGYFPYIPFEYETLLNRGIIKIPPITNFDKFIQSAQAYFHDIEEAIHIGSMYTVRTVLPYQEQNDARPTNIIPIDKKHMIVFSGKIPTCVSVASDINNMIYSNQ